jgi:hypothetical protein
MLAAFIAEQREHNRVSDKRADSVETIVIGPVKRGSTGAPILNGDGLPVRDTSKGLAHKRNWPQLLTSWVLQLLGLATAVLILINTVGT